MEKYNKLLNKIAELIEKGLYTSQDFKKTLEDTLKFKLENMVNKLNLVSREEFEVQKKLIQKIQKDLIKSKKKTTKVKKF
jgi:BMFP domain-containing protein YqiC